jgi:FkbM family methyltransferase
MRQLINKTLRKVGYRFSRLTTFEPLEALVYRNNCPEFFFVQIGGHDGKKYDPIHHYVTSFSWKGIIVEPVAEYFAALKETYKSYANVVLVKGAICEANGRVTIHKVNPARSDLPAWSKGIASLDADHHKKSNIPSDAIVKEEVEGITFDGLLERYRVNHIDLLQIDAEGYDYRIIKSLPFSTVKPRLINFEHRIDQNVMTTAQLGELTTLLISNGYRIIMQENDCLAYL